MKPFSKVRYSEIESKGDDQTDDCDEVCHEDQLYSMFERNRQILKLDVGGFGSSSNVNCFAFKHKLKILALPSETFSIKEL